MRRNVISGTGQASSKQIVAPGKATRAQEIAALANDRMPPWPRLTLRSAIKNVLGLALLAVGIYVVGGHLRYLGQSRKPSPAAITRALDQVIAAFPGTKASGVE